ncbi:MAG TPA: excinuclease ABC subunit UvrA [Candidatus Moranbacteria bacterium]|nr:excinuclease ABC subunit UvrA [Candidatus Moranbacteria bacterium]
MTKPNSKSWDNIIVRGARANNLKNIDVSVPREKLVVITGMSGSGKSSLAFDTIFAEGHRRYLEGMSSYARQFLDLGAKPDVDKIENLSPAISIDQRSVSRSPRSTVGTLTEIYDYLRVLYAKIGVPHCPRCHIPMGRVSNAEILEEILSFPDNTQVVILAKTENKSGNIRDALKTISQLGYARIRLDGKIMMLGDAIYSKDIEKHEKVEVVVDRIMLKKRNPDRERIVDSIETAFKLGRGFINISFDSKEDRFYNKDFVCRECFFKMSEITPKHFSFNNPEGACFHCSGLGVIKEVDEELIIPNKNLTLSEGAIIPWSKSNGRFSANGGGINILRFLGKKYGFSVDVPVKKLSKDHLKVIFYGPEEKEVVVKEKDGYVSVPFDGVIPILKKKYEEASFSSSRSDIDRYMLDKVCPVCQGKRLKDEYLSVLVGEKSIDEVVRMDIGKLIDFLKGMDKSDLSRSRKEIIAPLIKEMILKAEALRNVGLEYLSLFRGANSISGGEAQRIRLAVQIGSELMGIVYVLDEPSIGLHSRDTEKLVATMKNLVKTGNSLVVVEHDEEIIRSADWIIDMGPGAGEEGGEIIFSGNAKKLLSSNTVTAQYIKGKKKVVEKKKNRKGNGNILEIVGANANNLKNINVKFPLAKFVTICGVSGSGKSTLVSDILSRALSKYFFRSKEIPGEHKKIEGLKNIDKVITINQAPIGRTPRSNAATYTGVFSLIRDLFSQTEEAKKMGYDASRFSFNMKGGRCEDCQGDGTKKIEMHLLPDMYVKCETCKGSRYNQKTLDIEYQGVNIAQVLDMSVSYALRFFKKSPLIYEKLKTLEEVGLGYLKLGQSATNLSGGEAQRIKLAAELARKSTGRTLYILDEPTIGLHFEDTKKLLRVLDALVDKGNTVLVVEHNLDVIKNSDWVIELGPDGGDKGGEIIYAGISAGLKKCKKSWTGKYL